MSNDNHAPTGQLDIMGVPVTVRGEPVSDNEAASRARNEHEVDPRDGVAVMVVAVVVLVVITVLVLGGWWSP